MEKPITVTEKILEEERRLEIIAFISINSVFGNFQELEQALLWNKNINAEKIEKIHRLFTEKSGKPKSMQLFNNNSR